MTAPDRLGHSDNPEFAESTNRSEPSDPSRRRLLAAAGIGTGALLMAQRAGAQQGNQPGSQQSATSDPADTPPVAGLHLQFGADASAQMVVSWHTLQPVLHPRVLVGRLDGRLETVVAAQEASYVDGKSKQTVHAYHARLDGLKPDSSYLYAALHEGAEPQFGNFHTAPRGRRPFRFTSFGDQGTPTVGKLFAPPAGVTLASPTYVNDNLGSPAAGDTTLGVERVRPLFHLFNGDLCYANLAQDRVRTW